MILAKSAIKSALDSGELVIKSVIGFQPEVQISANSVDLTLGRFLIEISKEIVIDIFDPYKRQNTVDLQTGRFSSFDMKNSIIDLNNHPNGYTLEADCFYLAVTNEWIGSDTILTKASDKSSLGRMGVPTHFNAGFFDLGFFGHTTLEIAPIMNAIIYKNQMICQVSFTRVEGTGDYKTEGRYMNEFTGKDPMPILSKGVKILESII